MQAAVADPSVLDTVKTVVDIGGTLVTAVAVVVGACWAYFRFVKERTYRPRLEVTIRGQWREVDGRRLLHARVAVRNIGTSVVTLLQKGTGLRLQRLATGGSATGQVGWEKIKVFEIFAEHGWIEPGERISDDLLLALPVTGGQPVLAETRLIWHWPGGDGNIAVFARQIIGPDDTLADEE